MYADIVLNHLYTGDDNDESNPAVKQYVFDQAYRGGTQYSPYPTNEIKWVIKNATAGDYYLQIHGYYLNNPAKAERGYDVQIDFLQARDLMLPGLSGKQNLTTVVVHSITFPASGNTVRGHIESGGDF